MDKDIKSTSETRTGIVILVVSAIALIAYLVFSNYELKKGVVVNVIVVDSFIGTRGTNGLTCVFAYNGEEKRLTSGSSVALSKQSRLIYKHVPAIYSPNLDVIDVLVRPIDFKKYNIPFPDSMNWVIEEGFDK